VVAKHDAAKPLFLMVSFTAPAAPMFAPREFVDRNAAIRDDARRTYAGMVSALDDAVGQVTGALEKKGMLDDTLLVFFSDNGGAVAHKYPTGDGDVATGAADNDPYRDGQGSLYEGGVRVPALLRWPRGGLDGGTSNALMHVTDLYPMLLARAGASLDQRKPVDGIDAWKALTGDALAPRREVLLNIEDTRGALRVGDWKLVVYTTLPVQIELYDVPHDPGEEDNAAERFPERVKELMARLSEHAWDMQPSRYIDELGRARGSDLPMVWGRNPPKFGAAANANSRGDPSLTVERADVPGSSRQ
jgi:arylsulfatase A-like enzyme